ncbi:hypothetical protein M472_03945 [Sphingobacterium paucimobilis HER1398]|uniref:Uncharacterized protein n=1 Tax=Sphingobacterium paucimobilis HER1398 TaxID=1346330 RepID=U2HR07_9SPHI|nr:hypothetical protein M472_03945 [Sphingobacterium paucimobilis HER1398]
MVKKIYILLFAVIALFMGPQSAMARPVEAIKVCCKKMSSEKSCCKEKKKEATKTHNCKGGCKHCSCVSYVVDVKPPLIPSVTDDVAIFEFSAKKQKYFYVEIFHPNDADSIWLPPKIS